jgi:hypothetical protein
MKKHAIAIVIAAGTLLLTGCGTSAPAAKDGVATSDQMSSIDKVARAVAAEKYSDAASAGYYTFDNSGSLTQDAGKMAEHRKDDADEWDAIKADFDKGCTLVADNVNSSGVITSNVVCKGEDAPAHTISAQYLMGKLAHIAANNS